MSTDEAINEEAQEPEVQEEPQEEAQEEPQAEEQVSEEPSEDAAGEGDESPEWIDDDIRALASAYEIEDDDLRQFESIGDFHRACRMVDRVLTRDQRVTKDEEAPVEEPEKKLGEEVPLASEERDFTIDLDRYSDYDDDTKKVVEAVKYLQEQNSQMRAELDRLDGMNKETREQFDRLDQDRQERMHQQELDRFHEIMDKLPDGLYGGDGELSEEADGRRKEAWDAYCMIAQAMGGNGKRPSMATMVRRAAHMAHGEEMIAAEKKRIYGEMQTQSRGRRASPSRGKVIPDTMPKEPQTLNEQAQAIANDPEIAALFDKKNEESGN